MNLRIHTFCLLLDFVLMSQGQKAEFVLRMTACQSEKVIWRLDSHMLR